MSLNNHAIRLAETGQREAAAPVSQEAVDTYREPIAVHLAFLPDFADSLVAHAVRLTDRGEFDAAPAADREAVEVYGSLTSSDRVRYRDSWERAVNNVAVDLKNLGWREQATAGERSRLGLPDV